eukprot:3428881-Prymnesium_polylepis.1
MAPGVIAMAREENGEALHITHTLAPSMHHAWQRGGSDGSTEAHSRITFEVITFEPLRVVRADFTGFQWQHGAARHEELIALSKA